MRGKIVLLFLAYVNSCGGHLISISYDQAFSGLYPFDILTTCIRVMVTSNAGIFILILLLFAEKKFNNKMERNETKWNKTNKQQIETKRNETKKKDTHEYEMYMKPVDCSHLMSIISSNAPFAVIKYIFYLQCTKTLYCDDDYPLQKKKIK